MGRFVSLANAKTGNVFATSNPDFFNRAEWIAGVVSAEFDCAEDDLEFTEDNDGNDLIKLDGEVIVQIVDGVHRHVEPVRPQINAEDIVKSIRAMGLDGAPALSDSEAALMINLFTSVQVEKRAKELAA